MSRWVAALPLAALLALGVLFATFGLHHDPHFVPDALVGRRVPAETLPRLDTGAPTALGSQLAGRPTIINVFASWCAPCADESAALMALKAEGAHIVGVAYKDDPAKTRAFLAKLGDPFDAVLVDRSGRTGVDLGVSGVPETYLVGGNGVVVSKHAGPLEPSDAAALLVRAQSAGTPTPP